MAQEKSPRVSFLMPVLNEADYVADAVASVLSQKVTGGAEIILALGPSTDQTNKIVEGLAKKDSRIRVVTNPGRDIPVGLNHAIKASRGKYLVRVDAHSELPPGYTETAIADLETHGAHNVGGLMRARGRTRFQSAVARAYNSRFGLGGGSHHQKGAAGPAESAYLGVFRREVFDKVGMFDETLRRGEDWELNLRIREAGLLVWCNPELEVTYWPRDTWKKLARQFIATGTWRGYLVRRYGTRNSLRYFAPPTLVLASVMTLIWGALAAAIPGPPLWPALIASLGPASYVLALVIVGVSQRQLSFKDRWLLAGVYITMHMTWGYGFLVGLFVGAENSIDRSRVESDGKSKT